MSWCILCKYCHDRRHPLWNHWQPLCIDYGVLWIAKDAQDLDRQFRALTTPLTKQVVSARIATRHLGTVLEVYSGKIVDFRREFRRYSASDVLELLTTRQRRSTHESPFV